MIKKEARRERRLPQSQSARRVLLAHYSPLVSIDSFESLLPSANAPLGHRFSRSPAGPWPHVYACGSNPEGRERRPLRGRSPMLMLAAQIRKEENGGPCGAGAPCLCLRLKSRRGRTAAPAGPEPHVYACGSNPEGEERRPLRGLGPMLMLAAQIRKEENGSPCGAGAPCLRLRLKSGRRGTAAPAGPWPHAYTGGLNPEGRERRPLRGLGPTFMLEAQIRKEENGGPCGALAPC